jgi:hypothetical protein
MTNSRKILAIALFITVGALIYRSIQLKKQAANDNVASENIEEANEEQDKTEVWETYTNDEYGFSFSHPKLDNKCCTMGGPASEEVALNLTYADLDTVGETISDAPFAGIAVFVIKTSRPFEEYILKEKIALLKQSKEYAELTEQEFADNSLEEEISLDEQVGVSLINYSWDDIKRHYIPFPNSKNILIVSRSSAESTKFTFEEIFSTFKFLDIQEQS